MRRRQGLESYYRHRDGEGGAEYIARRNKLARAAKARRLAAGPAERERLRRRARDYYNRHKDEPEFKERNSRLAAQSRARRKARKAAAAQAEKGAAP